MIRQISSLLLNPTEKLKVQICIGLMDGNGQPSYCNIFQGEGASYLHLSPKPYVAIRYVDKGRPWSHRDNITITQRNIHAMKTQLPHFYQNLLQHEEAIYQYDGNGYIIAMHDTTPYEETIYLGMGQVLRLSPTTLYDEKNKPFPGIFLYINQLENEVELSMEEYESFQELFVSLQIHQEGMLLLNTYLTLCDRGGNFQIPIGNSFENGKKAMYQMPEKKETRVNVFASFGTSKRTSTSSEEKELVQGPNKTKQPTTLEELG